MENVDRLLNLRLKYYAIDVSFHDIKDKNLYLLIDEEILTIYGKWIDFLLSNAYNYSTEHIDYLEKSLDIFSNDIAQGVYKEIEK